MRCTTALSFLAALTLAACGGSPPPEPTVAEPPATAKPEPPPAPTATTPPEEKKEPAPEPEPAPAPPAAEAKPKSSAMISGVSLSDIDDKAMIAAVQKAGWAPPDVAVTGGTVGKYENFRFTIDKGGVTGFVELIRPAQTPTGSSASMMPPKDQKSMREATSAIFFDEKADLLLVVNVEGKPAEAKKLLDKLLKGK